LNKTKAAGIILITVGFIFSMVSLFADFIGVGDIDSEHLTLGTNKSQVLLLAHWVLFGFFFVEKEITKKHLR